MYPSFIQEAIEAMEKLSSVRHVFAIQTKRFNMLYPYIESRSQLERHNAKQVQWFATHFQKCRDCPWFLKSSAKIS